MKDCLVFKPCKNDDSFKLVPKCEINREKFIEKIKKKFQADIIAQTSFLTIINLGKHKLTINKNGEIIIREIKKEEVDQLAKELMDLI